MIFKKVARFIAFTLFGILALLLVVQLTFNFYINKHLVLFLKQQVSHTTQGQYVLSLDDIHLNLFTRTVRIDSVRFLPTNNCKDCIETQYGITADRVCLDGLGLIAYLRNDAAEVDQVEFSNLAINIYLGNKSFQQKTSAKKDSLKALPFSLYKVLAGKLNSLTIRTIDINNAKIHMYRGLDGAEPVFASEKNNIDIRNFTVNETVQHLNRMFLADTFNISMKTFSYQLNKGMYTLLGKNLNASYTDSLLTIDSLTLAPNFKKKEFGEVAGHQVSRTDLHTAKLSFKKMDVKLFIEHSWFVAKELDIEGLYLDVFRDKNIPFKAVRKPSLQELVRKVPFFISIDSIQVKDANIAYEDLAEGSAIAGKVTFNRLNGVITGLQNDTTIYTDDSKLKLHATTLFMNKAKLDAYYSFALNTREEVFTCIGKMGSMQLNAVNEMLENSGHIRIRSGQVDSLSFVFNSNGDHSNGKLKFLYHDLGVQLLDKTDNKSDAKHRLLTFIAEQFIIEEQNPSKNKPVRITDIYFQRDPYRMFFYYTWKSIQSGLMPAIGLKNFKMKK